MVDGWWFDATTAAVAMTRSVKTWRLGGDALKFPIKGRTMQLFFEAQGRGSADGNHANRKLPVHFIYGNI